jgi:hypothetical protein
LTQGSTHVPSVPLTQGSVHVPLWHVPQTFREISFSSEAFFVDMTKPADPNAKARAKRSQFVQEIELKAPLVELRTGPSMS